MTMPTIEKDITNKHMIEGGQILTGDCVEMMRTLPDKSVHCAVTSPPYFGLRDYGMDGQIGLEQTPDEFIAKLVDVFREVRRVLVEDGTLWLNLGDSYGKSKQLLGIPWRVALALQADGWILRQDIIWHKPNPMPESVRDRCTKAHEYIFLLSKSERYYYDHLAIQEDAKWERWGNQTVIKEQQGTAKWIGNKSKAELQAIGKKNRRSVWKVATRPYKGAHFATFPPTLIEPCILAGSRPGDTVLDPFFGAGTTGLVAQQHNRNWIGCELNPEYAELAKRRIEQAKKSDSKVVPFVKPPASVSETQGEMQFFDIAI